MVVDGSWYLPHVGRDPKAEYVEGHIPGAVFFDIDEIAETETDLPHMLPRPEKFASRMRKLGIGDGQRIVSSMTVPVCSPQPGSGGPFV